MVGLEFGTISMNPWAQSACVSSLFSWQWFNGVWIFFGILWAVNTLPISIIALMPHPV